MNIIAVVVTYNRLELLKRNIQCLRANEPLSRIVVVNNGSTDGTHEWLDAQADLCVVHQDNVGGAGGFCTGIERACQLQADWIWCMDDDVFPRADCLEHLVPFTTDDTIGMLAPRRIMEGRVYTNDFTLYNWTNPWASLYKGKLRKMQVDAPIEIAGTAFEGPLIRRKVIDYIGLPNKELFIFCDDTDYCIRTRQAGYRIMYIPTALMDKYKFFSADTWTERQKKKRWKRFYQVRNATYLNHHYGANWSVRYLRGLNIALGYTLTVMATAPFSNAYSMKDVAKFWQMYKDGVNERLGKM